MAFNKNAVKILREDMQTELKYLLLDQQIIDGLHALIARITKAFIQNNKSIKTNDYRKLVTPHLIRIAEIQIEMIIGNNQNQAVKNGF